MLVYFEKSYPMPLKKKVLGKNTELATIIRTEKSY